MREVRQPETQDIPSGEKEKLEELAKNLGVSEAAYPQTALQADELLEARLGKKPAGHEVHEADGPRPMEQVYARDWERICDTHEIADDVKACNPNYESGLEWQVNCQRCVPALEMRRRGYDVTAKPKPEGEGYSDILCYRPFEVWEKPDVIPCKDDGVSDIRKNMAGWGDGARAQVVVVWKNTNIGHTFYVEQDGGEAKFYDPQTGSLDASGYFKRVEPGSVKLCRIDDRDVTGRILDCCRKA